MATTTITILGDTIHAEFLKGDRTMLTCTSIKLDPLSLSYSSLSTLCKYTLEVENVIGITNPIILHNGKNSRFSAGGTGTCDIRLTIEDEDGNTDSTTITITII